MERADFASALSFRTGPPHHLVRLVKRPTLLQRLDESIRCRCVLVHAAAGYGKTVLLAQWRDHLEARDSASVWVTADRDDGAAGLLRWLQIALAEAGVMAGPLSDPGVQTGHVPDIDAMLEGVLHSLEEWRNNLVVIIDEYHLAQSPEVDQLIGRILRALPTDVTLVLSTRNRPDVDLAALRAMGQLAEVEQGELRMSDGEAADLLNASLSEAQVGSLNRYVEGWPIALQLANLRIDRPEDVPELLRSFSGSVDDMAEYMASHVLDELPEDLQTFLVETSILDLIDATAADAVRGRADSKALLDRLRRMNALIVPVDRDRRAFRHYPLFAEFLKSRRSGLPPARLIALHRAASRWFERGGDPVRAVRHAKDAGDQDRTRVLIEETCDLHLCLTDVPLARSLLSLAAPSDIRQSLRLQLTSAILDFKDGNLPEGRTALERTHELARILPSATISPVLDRDLAVMTMLRSIYQDIPVTREEVRRLDAIADGEPDGSWLVGLSYIMRCLIFLRRGELDVAKTMIFQAIRNLYETDSLYARMFSNFHLGTVAFWQGRLAEAHNAYRTAEQMALEHFPGNASVLALAQVLLAEVAYEQNNVTHATELLRDNMKILESSEIWSEIYLLGYQVAAAIAWAGKDKAGAAAVLDDAVAAAGVKGLDRLRVCAASQRIRYLAADGRLVEAEHLLVRDDLLDATAQAARTWREREEVVFAVARLRIAQGRPDDALALIDPVLDAARTQARQRSVLQAQILRALSWHASGRTAEALEQMIPVIEWGSVEGLVRTIVDEGPSMAEILAMIVERASFPAASPTARYADRLLGAFGDLEREREAARLLQLLTNREGQILAELGRGNSNKMIARNLDISEDGIKFHLKNIYRKLGVNTRVMALTVAQRMNLI